MDPYELLLKCISGLYTGKFFYLNSNEPEILGSGSFDEFGVTASLQDSNLESIHTKIQFKSHFYISDLSSQKGTWLRILPNTPTQITPNTQLRFHKSVFIVSEFTKDPLSLQLTCGRTVVSVTDRCSIGSKKPANFVLPSFEEFSAEIFVDGEGFFIVVLSGEVYSKVVEECVLWPGMEISVGNLGFEVCRHNYGHWGSIGMRATMEDSESVLQDLRILPEPVAFYAVFDGHGGSQCSQFLKGNLHKFLQKHLKDSFDIANWPNQISSAFSECDLAFSQAFPEFCKLIGSAVLVCLLWKNSLVISNCGDCRAVLSRNGQVQQLSRDHKPDHPSERVRIEKSGGFVATGRVQGKLGVSRAFGDFEFKAPKKLVTSEPETEIFSIDFRSDEFILIGCDGMFEAFSNQDAVKNIRNRLKRMKVTEQDPGRVVKDLVTEAVHMRRTMDNVTAILVTLNAGIA